MILKRKYDLDVVPGGVPQIIRVSRNDSSSEIDFTLYAGSGKLSLPGTTSLSVSVRGSTQKEEKSCGFSSNNGVVTVRVNLSKEMTAKVGKKPFELVLKGTDSGTTYTLVTATFILDIR